MPVTNVFVAWQGVGRILKDGGRHVLGREHSVGIQTDAFVLENGSKPCRFLTIGKSEAGRRLAGGAEISSLPKDVSESLASHADLIIIILCSSRVCAESGGPVYRQEQVPQVLNVVRLRRGPELREA